MVNNSTNINKTNNHLSHQLTEHKKTPYDVGYPVTSLEHAEQGGGVKPVNVIPILPPYVLNVWRIKIEISHVKLVSLCNLQLYC